MIAKVHLFQYTFLKTGTPEQKGNSITELVKLKDPRAEDALKDVIESEGTVLSMMAQYALCAIGATDVQEVFKIRSQEKISSAEYVCCLSRGGTKTNGRGMSLDLFGERSESERSVSIINQTMATLLLYRRFRTP